MVINTLSLTMVLILGIFDGLVYIKWPITVIDFNIDPAIVAVQ